MLSNRIFSALLITGVIATSATLAQAKSTGQRPRVAGHSSGNAALAVPIPAQERQGDHQLGGLGIIDRHTKAIVGSWSGLLSGGAGGGNRLVVSFTSDGIVLSSVTTEVALNRSEVMTPAHGVWAYLGNRQFAITSIGHLYDSQTGEYHGFIKIRAQFTLNEAGDQLDGADSVQLFGPDSVLIDTFPSSTVNYTRVKFEPFTIPAVAKH